MLNIFVLDVKHAKLSSRANFGDEERTRMTLLDVRLNLIKTGDRHRKDLGDLDALAASIDSLGLLQPIGLDANYRLIFGERRLRAFELLGRETIPARIVHVPSLLLAEHAENEIRKDFTPSERVAIGLAMEEAIKQTLGERRGRPKAETMQTAMDLHATDVGPCWVCKVCDHVWPVSRDECWNCHECERPPETEWLPNHPDDMAALEELKAEEIDQNFGQLSGQRSYEVAAKQAGFGNPETYRQAKTVVTQGAPELIEAMDKGEIAISTAAQLATADPETQRYAAENPKEAPVIAHNHRAQGTGENEWYTPVEYLDAARSVLGEIDLDPASSPVANKTVGAARIYTIDDTGLTKEWSGRIWLNPPYSQPAIAQFSEKLAQEWESGRVQAAIALTHNYTDTGWFHRLASTCQAICFTRGRIGFVNQEGKKAAPTQGQAFFYFGSDVNGFFDRFRSIGFVVEVRS